MDGLVFVSGKCRFNSHNGVLNIIDTDFVTCQQRIKQDNKLTKAGKINNFLLTHRVKLIGT